MQGGTFGRGEILVNQRYALTNIAVGLYYKREFTMLETSSEF